MFRYSICNEVDEDIFIRQCNALERNISNIVKKENIIDVDGSVMHIYNVDGKKITVCNSYYLNEVYVESEIDLKPYFKN